MCANLLLITSIERRSSGYICQQSMKGFIRLLSIGAGILFLGVVAGFYHVVLAPNTVNDKSVIIKVGKDWNYDSLHAELSKSVLASGSTFDLLAGQMNLASNIYPGVYSVEPGLNNREIIIMFRSGQMREVNVVIRSHQQGVDVFGVLARELEPDSAGIARAFEESKAISDLGLTGDKWACIFQANTYRFNWASSPEQIVQRFVREFKTFWNEERRQKAEKQGLSPAEVCILASIVDGESTKTEELATIAGVYLNRLKNRWPLGADPTLLFIAGEQGRQRVLNEDKEVIHPYNTYKNLGLPPGPIMLPSTQAIKAVLDPEDHSYMFFCARADFSGYHVFAKTLTEHNRNANKYRRALNKRNIYR